MANQQLSIWVIYERPLDFPDGFIARRFDVDQPSKDVVTGATLDEVRARLPAGLTRLERDPRDEPQIVECWL